MSGSEHAEATHPNAIVESRKAFDAMPGQQVRRPAILRPRWRIADDDQPTTSHHSDCGAEGDRW